MSSPCLLLSEADPVREQACVPVFHFPLQQRKCQVTLGTGVATVELVAGVCLSGGPARQIQPEVNGAPVVLVADQS
jgi:hypothetical protein